MYAYVYLYVYVCINKLSSFSISFFRIKFQLQFLFSIIYYEILELVLSEFTGLIGHQVYTKNESFLQPKSWGFIGRSVRKKRQ